MRFLTVGDWGIGSSLDVFEESERRNMEAVAAIMSSYARSFDPAFTLALGDNFYEDGVADAFDPLWEDAWRSVWLTDEGGLKGRPWYAILGNHGYHLGFQAALSQAERVNATDDDEWQMPSHMVYTIRHGGVAIVCLDTSILAPWETHATRDIYGGEASVQTALEIVDAEIAQAAASAPDWLFVAGHYPIRSNAEHGDILQLVELLLPILRRRRVDVYFCGHDHVLEHIVDDQSPLHFVISGAGAKTGYFQEFQAIAPPKDTTFSGLDNGFTAHEATTDTFVTKYINSQGTVVHEFIIEPWRPKCDLSNFHDCPDTSKEDGSSSASSSCEVWYVLISLLCFFLLATSIVMWRKRFLTRRNPQKNKTAELITMLPRTPKPPQGALLPREVEGTTTMV